MIWFIFIIILSCSSARQKRYIDYDFGEYYSRIRLFEYTDYTDVIFLKFNIYPPTTRANWTVIIHTDGKCDDYSANIHLYNKINSFFIKINLCIFFSISDVQSGAYPLIAPKNESFPEMYITTRHDLITTIFNRTISNTTIQLTNPLKGTWFAMVNKIKN